MLEQIFCHTSGMGCLVLTNATKQQKHNFTATALYMLLAQLQEQFLTAIKMYPHLTSKQHNYKVNVPGANHTTSSYIGECPYSVWYSTKHCP